MPHTREPLSDRVKAALVTDDPMLIRELQMLERLASGNVSYVAANGRFPKWTVERYLLVCGFAASLFVQAFYLGGKLQNVDLRLAAIESREQGYATRSEMLLRLDMLTDQLQRNAPPSFRSTTPPAFPRDEKFGAEQQ